MENMFDNLFIAQELEAYNAVGTNKIDTDTLSELGDVTEVKTIVNEITTTTIGYISNDKTVSFTKDSHSLTANKDIDKAQELNNAIEEAIYAEDYLKANELQKELNLLTAL